MSYSNYRRSASSALGQTGTKSGNGNEGWEIRQKLYPELGASQKQLLDTHFRGFDGKTETETFMVFGCTASYRDKLAIETDTAPKYVVDGVHSISLRPLPQCRIPIQVLSDSDWFSSLGLFSEPMLSRARHPAQQGYSRYIEISKLDTLETYFGAVSGTLSSFWNTGNENNAMNLWRVMHVLRNVGDRMASVGETLSFNDFEKLLTERDLSAVSARSYKRTIAAAKPTCVFMNQLNSMVQKPELIHKARNPNLDYILLGAIFAPECFNPSANLRAVLERSLKGIGLSNLSEFTDKAELVQYIHEKMGVHTEAAIRWWAFFLSVLKTLFMATGTITPESFISALGEIRNSVKDFDGGIPGLVLMIDPECHLEDEDLAEMMLTVSELSTKDKKFAVLVLPDPGADTPRIDTILLNNIQRVQAIADERLAIRKAMEDEALAAVGAAENPLPKNSAETAWVNFKDGLVSHMGSSSSACAYIKILTILAEKGSDVKTIEYFIDKAHDCRLFGRKRSCGVVSMFAVPDTPVWEHRAGGWKCPSHSPSSRNRRLTTKLIHDLFYASPEKLEELMKVKQQVQQKKFEAPVVASIKFVKFELARVMKKDWQQRIDAMMGELKFECQICMTESKAKPVVLHNEVRHAVCVGCLAQIKSHGAGVCPFCRVLI